MDPAFKPDPNIEVETLLLDGSTLYAGGRFTSIGGQPIKYVAKLNAVTGAADAAWNPDPNGFVYSLTLDGNHLYAGGNFTQIDGRPQQYFAKLDKATGNVMQTISLNNDVFELAQTPGGVYAGGTFIPVTEHC